MQNTQVLSFDEISPEEWRVLRAYDESAAIPQDATLGLGAVDSMNDPEPFPADADSYQYPHQQGSQAAWDEDYLGLNGERAISSHDNLGVNDYVPATYDDAQYSLFNTPLNEVLGGNAGLLTVSDNAYSVIAGGTTPAHHTPPFQGPLASYDPSADTGLIFDTHYQFAFPDSLALGSSSSHTLFDQVQGVFTEHGPPEVTTALPATHIQDLIPAPSVYPATSAGSEAYDGLLGSDAPPVSSRSYLADLSVQLQTTGGAARRARVQAGLKPYKRRNKKEDIDSERQAPVNVHAITSEGKELYVPSDKRTLQKWEKFATRHGMDINDVLPYIADVRTKCEFEDANHHCG
ncbi:hypothetical protein BD626DRAFT_583102 [Schizophyllum amplum]|uniref:Uncharacterized protein n=1 Tax=Schizophyllum amplum TaxID=97359 RepID=A0A550CIT0_9AGAR|nr:hypothetical protein BD626DRAFT_583102 [Auriculariopsis ampla]